ncbi:hypothetical protein NUU61_008783 [Penicillium alfredii]|uniref:Manganese lipoxygenase n=1 Tax=Penicillium alfredii TaxID=1506179 RepID=A0A9W9EM33_9EURO|nr:uncharacterized protein NUU61_008783 [Penicillium alfredii]KAJ5084204.1 hypothetical protein NUU61_008783 [Penicillium alfredii]
MVRTLSDAATMPGFIETPSKMADNPEDESPQDDILNDIDTGVLLNELTNLSLMPKKVDLAPHEQAAGEKNPESLIWTFAEKFEPERLPEGTYRGTQLALTKVYDLIEQRFSSYTDVTGVEPLLPFAVSREDRKSFFAFTKSKDDGYPPHLDLGLNKKWANSGEKDKNQRSTLGPFDLFNPIYLLQLQRIMSGIIPKWFLSPGTPDKGKTIADVENYNREQIARAKSWLHRWTEFHDIFNRPNVGELLDWYSDARFAQQQFTGTNPTTIKKAPKSWISYFIRAAKTPEDALAKETITNLSTKYPNSLYVQDYSYFRDSAGFTDPEAEIKRVVDDKTTHYGCAAVSLFFLDDNGQLHPLAIVTDWRGSMEASVTIHNRELFKRWDLLAGVEKPPNAQEKRVDEAHDWPWRYAKTCVQTSDWFRHEVTVHLTRTHLVEEAVIVSANRQFESDHPVYQILRPHWQKTLALNGAARGILVPSVILQIIGFEAKEALAFIRSEYRSYDFENSYVPKDLENRGFPPQELDSPKFHNYTYARCINSMWKKIRTYVKERLSLAYASDEEVEQDKSIGKWWNEMQSPSGADLRSFPEIHTFDSLVDCVTMCIHIASPQHTAVNYLQDYYQGFVINKPSCFFTPPPTSLEDLLDYTENDLVKALPINHTMEWLLSSHVPYLLSFKPDESKETLMNCIKTARGLAKDKKARGALDKFYKALQASAKEFQGYDDAKWDSKEIPYSVLKPKYNAVSILI